MPNCCIFSTATALRKAVDMIQEHEAKSRAVDRPQKHIWWYPTIWWSGGLHGRTEYVTLLRFWTQSINWTDGLTAISWKIQAKHGRQQMFYPEETDIIMPMQDFGSQQSNNNFRARTEMKVFCEQVSEMKVAWLILEAFSLRCESTLSEAWRSSNIDSADIAVDTFYWRTKSAHLTVLEAVNMPLPNCRHKRLFTVLMR